MYDSLRCRIHWPHFHDIRRDFLGHKDGFFVVAYNPRVRFTIHNPSMKGRSETSSILPYVISFFLRPICKKVVLILSSWSGFFSPSMSDYVWKTISVSGSVGLTRLVTQPQQPAKNSDFPAPAYHLAHHAFSWENFYERNPTAERCRYFRLLNPVGMKRIYETKGGDPSRWTACIFCVAP